MSDDDNTTHAETIIELFEGKLCDIYMTDHVGTSNYSESAVEELGIIVAKVISAHEKMLLVERKINGETIKILLNSWMISSIMEHNPKISLVKALGMYEQSRLKR